MKVKITAVAKQLPKYYRETKDIIPFVKLWMQDQDERFQRKVTKLFEGAAVDKRYSIMDPEDVFIATSFEEKNNIYAREVVILGEQALKKSLNKANLKATDIDFIITVSCTGIMIPSMDAYLINSLQMKQDIVRLPVTEMGCAAGVSGIIYAKNFLKANPNKRAARNCCRSTNSNVPIRRLFNDKHCKCCYFWRRSICGNFIFLRRR